MGDIGTDMAVVVEILEEIVVGDDDDELVVMPFV